MTVAAATLIVITGLPGSGKSTFGRWLAKQINLPYVYKDGIKEILFDTVGWSDVAFSKRLGAASTELLFYVADELLAVGQSLILESNFAPALAEPKFAALQERYSVQFIQVVCRADEMTLLQRHQARAHGGTRHPGHLDEQRLPEAEQFVQGPQAPLAIGGSLIELDTSQVSQDDYQVVLTKIKSACS